MIRISSRCFSVSSIIERAILRVDVVLLLNHAGTGPVTKHALNADERLFQRRAAGQFYSKPAPNIWYGSAAAARWPSWIRNRQPVWAVTS
jgi:hypothetical protein